MWVAAVGWGGTQQLAAAGCPRTGHCTTVLPSCGRGTLCRAVGALPLPSVRCGAGFEAAALALQLSSVAMTLFVKCLVDALPITAVLPSASLRSVADAGGTIVWRLPLGPVRSDCC